MIRKRFFADGEESACISICGLGLFRLWINGHLVSADEGVPAWTDYEDRGERRLIYPISDTFAHRALYVNYDVSAFLVPGENVIGVLLGNGWFNQRKRNVEGDLWYGLPKLLFDLELQTPAGERHVVSDTDMCWTGSHLVENNLYYGEVQDLSRLQSGFSLPGHDETGWLSVELVGPGPGPMVCETGLLMTDSRTLYEKWLQDILDGQDPQTGHVQHTAPFYGGGGGPGGWGSAIVEVPWQLYQYTGNPELLERCWSPMMRYADYLQEHSEHGLVVSEEKDGWCLGDWCGHPETRLLEPFVNTYFHIRTLMKLESIARIFGKPFPHASRLGETRLALRTAFYDEEANTCCKGVQGADAFFLDLGLGDEAMCAALARHYDEAGALDTGIFGTEILLRILCDGGYADTAFRLMSTTAFPSFGHMMAQGATTLWEDWGGHTSHNHPMFGACVKLLFQAFLGIRQRSFTAGFQDLVIEPQFVEGLDKASGSLVLPTGTVSVEWRRLGPQGQKKIDCLIQLSGSMRAELKVEGRVWDLEQGENWLTVQG